MNIENEFGKNEKIYKKYNVRCSIIFPSLYSYFELTNKRIIINHPITFFGIPMGNDTATFPLRNVGGVRTRTNVNPLLIIGCLLFLFFSLLLFVESFIGGLIGLIISVYIFTQAYQTFVSVVSAGSATEDFSYVPWERKKVTKMIKELNKLIAEV
jgi:hypothetical protein